MNRKVGPVLLAATALLALAATTGCRNHMPHGLTWPAGGDIIPTHAKPPEGGYYSNWDPYAVELTVTPIEDVNPVMTQHVLIATVKDKNGKPLPNRRVEWIISEGSVGDIVEVDESGWRASRGYKVDNSYAVSHTNNFKHVLDMGNDDPSDDISLTEGQSWCVITSPIEGTSNITVYAPGIYDWAKHKVFVKKHWYDVQWSFPPPATNPIGTTHEFVTDVSKYSDGSPLEGYLVTYKIVDGPSGSFTQGGSTATVRTGADGLARVTLQQNTPAEGTNNVEIDIQRPANEACCEPAVHIATGYTSKTWIGPEIAITKECTPTALVGGDVNYTITVTNPSQVSADNVVVTDNLPSGIQFVSSNPASSGGSWSLGSIPAGGSATITINARATTVGTFDNVASVTAMHGLSDQDNCQTVVTAPALAIEKTCTQQVTMCDTIEYEVIVRNTGDGPAANVQLSDQLPAGLALSDGRTSVQANIGTLAPGEAKRVRYSATASSVGSYTNTARATADGGLSAEASCTTTVSNPSLAVTKTGPDVRYVGRDVAYQITVTNNGDAPARDATLVDTLPGGTSFVSATDGGSASGGTVTWALGTMQPGQSRTVGVTVRANSVGVYRNTVVARSYCTEATAEVSTTVKGIPAVLLEVIDIEDPDEIGTTDQYIITVTNQGSAPDTNIRIVATIQPEAEFVSAGGATNATANGRVVTFEPFPSLAPKQKVSWQLVVRAIATGDTRFAVEMNTDQLTSPVNETESTRFYE